jgi:hypothetical protein
MTERETEARPPSYVEAPASATASARSSGQARSEGRDKTAGISPAVCFRTGSPLSRGRTEEGSGARRFGFTQRGDLQEKRIRIDAGMIVRQHVERHRGNLGEEFVQCRRIGGGRNVVAMAGPDGGFLVP